MGSSESEPMPFCRYCTKPAEMRFNDTLVCERHKEILKGIGGLLNRLRMLEAIMKDCKE